MSHAIHIVTDHSTPLNRNYLLAKLSWHWQQAGHSVSFGPGLPCDSDLGIIHFDESVIAPDKIPDTPANFCLLNESALDISKSTFSSLIISRNDSWDGPVILKSNQNAFGAPEWINSQPNLFSRAQRNLARISWRLAHKLPPWEYPVLNSLRDIPAWVWDHPEIVVERFMPEREGSYYCVRGWVFFGSRGYTFRQYSRSCMVKGRTTVRDEILGDPPPELELFRQEKGFDFGKFDYVEVDGKPILIDINKTPVIKGSTPDTPRMRHLAGALDEFLNERNG